MHIVSWSGALLLILLYAYLVTLSLKFTSHAILYFISVSGTGYLQYKLTNIFLSKDFLVLSPCSQSAETGKLYANISMVGTVKNISSLKEIKTRLALVQNLHVCLTSKLQMDWEHGLWALRFSEYRNTDINGTVECSERANWNSFEWK